MKVVIQCASQKQSGAGRLRDAAGREVVFVARPDLREEGLPAGRRCRPDDPADGDETWRDVLVRYNRDGSNPDGLLPAGDLYRPRECPDLYRELCAALGRENVLVLSAGWGLIRSDFLTPDYDITFSAAKNVGPCRRRSTRLSADWHDFDHLRDACTPGEEVHFFGGKDYLPLYYSLTDGLRARKVIHHKAEVPTRGDYEYRRHGGTKNQNWHYPAVAEFVREHLAHPH
jgi:hypothetical protein